MKKIIEETKSEEERLLTFSTQYKNCKKAIRSEFYIEALCIEYAMFENQLKEFLYLSGCIDDEGVVYKKYRKILKYIWHLDTNKKFNIDKISNKIDYIKKILNYYKNFDKNIHEVIDRLFESKKEIYKKQSETYCLELKEKIINDVDINNFINLLNKLDEWRNLRNEVVHGLLNKNLKDLTDKLKQWGELGIQLVDDLKKIIDKYKTGVDLRKKLKLIR